MCEDLCVARVTFLRVMSLVLIKLQVALNNSSSPRNMHRTGCVELDGERAMISCDQGSWDLTAFLKRTTGQCLLIQHLQ